jgi:1,4-dihydroxy-2-naphthoyl-CoA synthase
MECETIRCDVIDAGQHGIATVTLDWPDTRNAQNKRMTYELNAAFDDASRRKDVKVIVRAHAHNRVRFGVPVDSGPAAASPPATTPARVQGP